MKAVVISAAQSRPQLEERPRPTPGPGEVLIAVRACGVCHGDLMAQEGAFPFARYPVVPGHEVAGVVAAGWRGCQRTAEGSARRPLGARFFLRTM